MFIVKPSRFRILRTDASLQSVDALSVQKLQVVLLELLDAPEKGNLRFGETFLREKLGSSQFKSTGDVRHLEEAISGGFNVGYEFGARCKYGEGLLEKVGQPRLAIVIVYLKLVERGKLIRFRQQETDDLLEKRVVDVLRRTDEVFVEGKALVSNIDIVQKEEHASENTSSFFAAHPSIFAFTSDQRSCMNTMVMVKPHRFKGLFKFLDFGGNVDALIVEYHADKIVPRGLSVVLIAPGFINEYADFMCSHGEGSFCKTKARIAPRLRQESFPLAGDAGFRRCRSIFYQKCPLVRKRDLCKFRKRQRPNLSPALHRIAEAQRSVNNPSWGSVGIVSNSLQMDKRANL